MLNFGNEPGLKSEISVCGPSVRSRRKGAFSGITRGLHAAQGKPNFLRRSEFEFRIVSTADRETGRLLYCAFSLIALHTNK